MPILNFGEWILEEAKKRKKKRHHHKTRPYFPYSFGTYMGWGWGGSMHTDSGSDSGGGDLGGDTGGDGGGGGGDGGK